MEPHERVHYLFYVVLRKPFIIIGYDFYPMKEFKPYLLTYLGYVLLLWYFIGVVNTILNYDMVAVLHMVSFTGMSIEVLKVLLNIND